MKSETNARRSRTTRKGVPVVDENQSDMTMVKISLATLKPLHLIAKYMGIWPSFNTHTMAKCGRHYVFGIVALLVIICEFAFALYGKIFYVNTVERSVYVMLILSDFATVLTNLSAIVNINFIAGERLYDFLQQLQQLESVFRHVRKDERGERRKFYLELSFGHLVYFGYVMYNLWEWTHTLGWKISRYTLVRDLQFYRIMVSVLLIRNYVLMIQYKIEAINFVLRQYGSSVVHDGGKNHNHHSHHSQLSHHSQQNRPSRGNSQSGENMFVVSRSICSACSTNSARHDYKLHQPWTLEYISKIYTKLANCVSDFNEIFGWHLVVLQLQLIINLLMPLNLMLVYGGGAKIMDQSLDYNLYVLCAIWFSIPLVHMITVVSACDKTKREGAKMPTICYTLIIESTDEEFIKKAKDLALQGHLQAPEFTAAGFFSFNYSLVFPTITSIISYFIVLVQFRS